MWLLNGPVRLTTTPIEWIIAEEVSFELYRLSALLVHLKLAATLRHHGVKTFYTRTVGGFTPVGWFEVVDPIG